MINQYPNYSNIDKGHLDLIRKFTSGFDPYSDFNFLSLYSWNIDDSTSLSMLNGNLVILLPDYLTGEPIISVLGKTKMRESLEILLKDHPKLHLVPKVVKDSLSKTHNLIFTPDEDNFDYIYKLSDHSSMSGKKFSMVRNKYNKFLSAHGKYTHVQKISFSSPSKVGDLINVYNQWYKSRGKIEDDIKNERNAIIRLLENAPAFNLECYEIFIDKKLVGFSINEILPKGFANSHFQKCLLDYEGIDAYLTNFVSKDLMGKGCEYINWEQDLGIEGLRHQKRAYRPVKMLEKYIVT